MKKEKTMHELAKEFPNKTYRELEKYREEDRQQEAGVCIMGEARKDREESNWFPDGVTFQEKYEKEHKLRQEAEGEWERECSQAGYLENKKLLKRAQEAEGELTIIKGIETNRVKEAQDALANALEINESHQKLNGRLQERVTELEEENKKMHDALNKRMNNMRKSGM